MPSSSILPLAEVSATAQDLSATGKMMLSATGMAGGGSGVLEFEEEPAPSRVGVFAITKRIPASVASLLTTLIVVGAYITICAAAMLAFEPDWTTIDALYFVVTFMSTVGYGDISPSSFGSRTFVVFAIIIGAMQSQIGGFDGEQQQETQSLFAVSAVSTTAMQSALPGQWPETKE